MNKWVSPKVFPYFGLLALGFPVLVIVHLIFTFIWLVKKEMIFILFLLLTVFLFFPIKKYIHFGGKMPEVVQDTENELKILTYNIRYANGSKDLRTLENYIIEQDVDIAFFQEIYTRQWRSEETFLADRYNAVFDLVSISSKYPIINKQKIILPGNGYACMADIQKGQEIIRCVSLYLEPMFLNKNIFKIKEVDEATDKTKIVTEKLTTGFKKHEVQIDLLSKYIKESPYPIIVCGDFNSVPLSYEYFALKKDLVDVFEVSGKNIGMTFYDYFYPIRIDYIFTSKDFIPKNSYVNKRASYSDHYPVFATLQLKENN
ncbi:MAG: endonuclease/exonuclease/phosphatase family protein [Flavobacteriaceae bacterium]|jgi:endonuclease/exonuclease/phosphatase family metal-dependent hydrolase|nr:endonuclease/exonuclease/phosphatase family protein [Flavobacteriaceae bacterium]